MCVYGVTNLSNRVTILGNPQTTHVHILYHTVTCFGSNNYDDTLSKLSAAAARGMEAKVNLYQGSC